MAALKLLLLSLLTVLAVRVLDRVLGRGLKNLRVRRARAIAARGGFRFEPEAFGESYLEAYRAESRGVISSLERERVVSALLGS